MDNVSPFFDAVQQSKQHTSEPSQSNPMAQYETPLITVDIVVYTIHQDALKVLLFQRQQEPYQGMWSIPGGFIYEGEALETAAARWLSLKTKVSDIFLEQLGAFGTPNRDPRTRIITVAYYALVSYDNLVPESAHDANAPTRSLQESTQWFDIAHLPALAFDHTLILNTAMGRLKERLETSSIAFQLLPEKFTLTELQRVYELILNKTLDKRNFRKKMLAGSILQEIGETKMEGFHRPAQLYIFKPIQAVNA